MIDSAILTIIPPIVASVLAYIISNMRAKMQYAKTVSNIQCRAIEIVSAAEEKMRLEIRSELAVVRQENEKRREEVSKLRHKLDDSNELIATLRSEIISLKSLVDTYKEQLSEFQGGGNKL